MGKITDAAIAIIVIIVGIWVLSRLGLTLPAIEKMFRTFFFPSSGATTNTTASLVVGVVSTSKLRKKIQEKEDDRKRNKVIQFLLSAFKKRGDA